MELLDLVVISLRTLAKNKLRSGLTVLGVVIGIAAVTTMVSIGQGDLLRAIDVTLGLIDNQYAELIAGELSDGDEVITALDTTPR